MQQALLKLQIQLENFRIDREELRELQDQKEREILMSNRLIKTEVIDIAVMMDEITEVIDRQE